MTIRRGEAWGSEVPAPASVRLAGSDAELARLVGEDPEGDHGVTGGDLHRTVGQPSTGRSTVWRLPIDVLRVRTDRSTHVAVAHVTVRRSWWRGPLVFVCNVDHIGSWYVAPRAHPNDGRLDVVTVDGSMSIRDRWEFRRRLPTGRHVPHPAVTVRSATSWSWHDDGGARVSIDGVDIGVRTEVTVELQPDGSAVLV